MRNNIDITKPFTARCVNAIDKDNEIMQDSFLYGLDLEVDSYMDLVAIAGQYEDKYSAIEFYTYEVNEDDECVDGTTETYQIRRCDGVVAVYRLTNVWNIKEGKEE